LPLIAVVVGHQDVRHTRDTNGGELFQHTAISEIHQHRLVPRADGVYLAGILKLVNMLADADTVRRRLQEDHFLSLR
jgi:hypothetical protein